MKIVITGVNGYVSNSLRKWLIDNGYNNSGIKLLSLKDDNWKRSLLSGVDVIIHCAALVHQLKKDLPLEEYERVNTKLTIDLASKAKEDGVKQFIFMSTKGVYGLKKNCFHEVVIDENTPVKPFKKYGFSKYKAEQVLRELQNDSFKVAIIRAPFIYGKGCPGNYQSLRKVVLRYRIVPKISSRISFLYIDNLCELIRQIIEQKREGLYMPQNLPVHSSSEMALLIAHYNHKRVVYTSLMNPLVRVASLFVGRINSAFGSSHYAEQMSVIDGIDYQIVGFEESIRLTES